MFQMSSQQTRIPGKPFLLPLLLNQELHDRGRRLNKEPTTRVVSIETPQNQGPPASPTPLGGLGLIQTGTTTLLLYGDIHPI